MIYLSLLLALVAASSRLMGIETNKPPLIDKAFVTFATPSYFPLLEVTIQSVHAFSKKPIIAYGINADIPFSIEKYPRLIRRRIDVSNADKRPFIYFQKFNVLLQSNVRYGIYIEADDVVNYAIDDLFEECKRVEAYPLSPIHPHDPNNQSKAMKFLNVTTKTNPYVHAHIIFSNKCLPFIQECYDFCLKYGRSIDADWDETVLNVMLWKYGVKDWYLPIIDPWFTRIDYYVREKPIEDEINRNIHYYMFHGCKDPAVARNILSILQKNRNKAICPQ